MESLLQVGGPPRDVGSHRSHIYSSHYCMYHYHCAVDHAISHSCFFLSPLQSGGDNISTSRSRLNSESSSRKLENGELDYKKLYEESQAELARMRDTLSKTEEELNQVKASVSVEA